MNSNSNIFLAIKDEYTNHLVDILTPYIYEGLTAIYFEAVRVAEESNKPSKTLIIFQKMLDSIDTWNQLKLETETNRIKIASGTSDYLDDVVKVVIKSNIILLSYSNTISNVISQSFYNSLSTTNLIHRCYSECGKDAHNNPWVFLHGIEPMDVKRNQVMIKRNIEEGIVKAIRKILPISLLAKEFLVNTINIVEEPPKIELMRTGIAMDPVLMPFPTKAVPSEKDNTKPLNVNSIANKAISEKLNRDINKLIQSESNLSEKQKIEKLMNITNLISDIPMNPKEMTISSSSKKVRSPTRQFDPFQQGGNYNHKQSSSRSDDALDGINFDEQETIDIESERISATHLSGPSISKKAYPLESERIDPNKVEFIEYYGTKTGSQKSSSKNKRV